MKKFLTFLAVICLAVILVGCGKSKSVIGTWEGKTEDSLEATFTFEKNDKVKYKNSFGFETEGKYTIKDNIITIKLELWEKEKEYEFDIKDGKLSLIATDSYSPSYLGMKKVK